MNVSKPGEWVAFGPKRESLPDYAERMHKLIADHTHDPEVAHALEDEMYRQILWAIANGMVGMEDATKACAVAMTTSLIKFDRWYA